MMQNPLTWLSKRRFPYKPLISVEISRGSLIHNINQFAKIAPDNSIAPTLKSNAYGHGIIEIAKIIEEEIKNGSKLQARIPFFIVDSYFEAIALRAKGIETPLLVIGYTRPETILTSKLKNISYAITDIETIKIIANNHTTYHSKLKHVLCMFKKERACGNCIKIHLKIDTGMHRQGILPEEIDQSLDIIKENKKIILEGICSHLSDADGTDKAFTEKQIKLWNSSVEKIVSQFPNIKYIHLSNTYGHLFSKSIKANVSRLGIGLYGPADRLNNILDLKPVLEMKTIITSVKKISAGESVGYNNTFVAKKDMTIATIPVGYYEGLDRRLSNIGFVEILNNKTPCPIIGRVSMNITSIDITDIPDIRLGTEVLVISNNPNSKCSIESIAKLCNTITYESAIRIPEHLKRVVVE